MEKYVVALLNEVKTVILPGIGAFTLTDVAKREVRFLPNLNYNDGKLATYIATHEGITKLEADILIEKHVREIQAVLDKGECYERDQFGRLCKQNDGKLVFEQWNNSISKTSTPKVTGSSKNIIENEVVVQKTYDATDSYSEEDQWNDDLDILPINYTIKRPKQAILEKAQRDKPTRNIVFQAILLVVVFLIGGTILFSLFYNSGNRALHQVRSNLKKSQRILKKVENPKIKLPEEPKTTPTLMLNAESFVERDTIINVNIQKPHPTSKRTYHIIVGAFKIKGNAENFVNSLLKQGAKASIIAQLDGLYLVAYGSYPSRIERKNHLIDAKRVTPRAWLMKYP
jgi:nucleoid DNA-binding protein/cell division septation protein DedD